MNSFDMGSDTLNGAPLVSIVVPAYNHEKYVGAAIDSLIAQTWPNLELIIVNDGSPDATLEVIHSRHEACEARFTRYEVVDQQNAGVAVALNRGIEAARSEYVYLLSSDDVSEPDAIATLVPMLVDEADVAVASGDCDFIDETGKKTSRAHAGTEYTSFMRFCTSHRNDMLGDNFGSYASLLVGNYILPGLLLRRRAVLEVGGYDPQCVMEDYDLWLKLAKCHRFRFVDRVLSHYRWHGKNTISQGVERISYDQLNLLGREAEYCFANGFGGLWNARSRAALADYRAYWQYRYEAAIVSASSAHQEEMRATMFAGNRTVAELECDVAQSRFELEKSCAMLNTMTRERDAALRELERIRSSLLWRAFKPVRAFKDRLRRTRA